MAATRVHLRTVTGVVHELVVDSPLQVDELYEQAARRLGLREGGFKLVRNGTSLAPSSSSASGQAAAAAPGGDAAHAGGGGGLFARRGGTTVHLREGDLLLVTPVRKAPSERLQRAAAQAAGVELDDDVDDEALRFCLKPDAPAWEAWLARTLQRWGAPELLLVWLFMIGPSRLLGAAAVLAGARLVYSLDPQLSAVYLLVAMVVAIFTAGLGTKQEGEASAYSVFNPGLRRLPGQLDADDIDRQIRRGQM